MLTAADLHAAMWTVDDLRALEELFPDGLEPVIVNKGVEYDSDDMDFAKCGSKVWVILRDAKIGGS